jgi:uncharacterized protein (TIGR02678 family)
MKKSEITEEIIEEQMQQATRALLRHPLLFANGPQQDAFRLIHRFQKELTVWFAHHPGWSLKVNNEFARLYKTPAKPSAHHPAQDFKSKKDFTRRRYVLLCLALAVLERSELQTTLGDLANHIRSYGLSNPVLAATGIDFEQDRSQRSDLVQVMRFLVDNHVIKRIYGDEEKYLEQNRNGQNNDVLYTIQRPVLSILTNLRHGPSMAEEQVKTLEARCAYLRSDLEPLGKDARNQVLRTQIIRQLLDETVVYYAELEPEEREYLASQRPHILKLLEQATGLIGEARQEGLALVDERGDASDMNLPEEGTIGHLTLLLAEILAEKGSIAQDYGVSYESLVASTAELKMVYGRRWNKLGREAGSEKQLTKLVLERLEAMKLIRWHNGLVVAYPAIARFRLSQDTLGHDDEDSDHDEEDGPRIKASNNRILEAKGQKTIKPETPTQTIFDFLNPH